MSRALSVAFFMATMRALCSDALDSRSLWKTATLVSFGMSAASTSSASGSMVYAATAPLPCRSSEYLPRSGVMEAMMCSMIFSDMGRIFVDSGLLLERGAKIRVGNPHLTRFAALLQANYLVGYETKLILIYTVGYVHMMPHHFEAVSQREFMSAAS